MSEKGPCQMCLGDRHLIVWRSGERESRVVVIQCPECNPEAYRKALVEVARRASIFADRFDHNYDGNDQEIAQVAEFRAERIVSEYLAEHERTDEAE